MSELRQDLEVLQDVGDITGREAEPEPVGADRGVGRVVRDRRITGEQEVDPDTDRVADDAGTPPGRDRPQPSESLDRAPRARLRPVDAAPETRSRGCPAEVAIEALTRDRASLPLDGRADRRVVQEPEIDQGTEEVAVEAVHDGTVAVAPAEPAVRSLGVLKHVPARTSDATVTRVGAHLVEEHQGPDRAGVLRPVPGPRLHPVARRLLAIEDRRDGRHAHRGGASASDGRSVPGLVQELAQGEVTDRGVLSLQEPRDRVTAQRVPPRAQRGHSSLK